MFLVQQIHKFILVKEIIINLNKITVKHHKHHINILRKIKAIYKILNGQTELQAIKSKTHTVIHRNSPVTFRNRMITFAQNTIISIQRIIIFNKRIKYSINNIYVFINKINTII